MMNVEQKIDEPIPQPAKMCTRCKVHHPIDQFNIKRNDKRAKQCIRCCHVMAQFRAKSKCPHGKQKAGCKKCLGTYKPKICDICQRNINNDK